MKMEINDSVSFTYLKGAEAGVDVNGVHTKDYATKAESYSGKVVGVRDIEESPLSFETLMYGKPKGERSQNLVTVELKDGDTKAFYDGRMVGLSAG
tara:strand:- start:253 stop:540 length:288 start_codon:yes stop_codon:yes gene_type:complete